MKESKEYLDHETHKAKLITLKLVNGLLAIGTVHYLIWAVYSLIKWI